MGKNLLSFVSRFTLHTAQSPRTENQISAAGKFHFGRDLTNRGFYAILLRGEIPLRPIQAFYYYILCVWVCQVFLLIFGYSAAFHDSGARFFGVSGRRLPRIFRCLPYGARSKIQMTAVWICRMPSRCCIRPHPN